MYMAVGPLQGKAGFAVVNAGIVREPGQCLLGARTKWSKGCPSQEDKFKPFLPFYFPSSKP